MPFLIACHLIAWIGGSHAQIQVGIGAGHPAGGVDSAGSRMNIETSPGSFPTLEAGTYLIREFTYSNSAGVADVQPFLAVSNGQNRYTVIWIGATEESPGTNALVTIDYPDGDQVISLDSATAVYAGFNAAGPIVKFGGGLTDHNNPANFSVAPGTEIASWTNPNLARSYAFEIVLESGVGEVADILLEAAISYPAEGDAVVLSSAAVDSAVGSLVALSEFETPVADVQYSLVAGEGDSHNGSYAVGGDDGDQLVVSGSLVGLADVVHSVRVQAEGENGVFSKALTFTVKLDSDADALIDDWETEYGSLNDFAPGADHDADKLNDEDEFLIGSNPADDDTDGDSLLDGDEIADGTNPVNADTDSDGLDDGAEALAQSDPLVPDTDGDTISDGDEVSDANGFVTDPTNPDTDGDGFGDEVELELGSDPTNPSSLPKFRGRIGAGADLPGSGVDSAGTRMNIENSADTFPVLAPGTYAVTDFVYSASTDTSDLLPFLAINDGGDSYTVLWAGPVFAASGLDSVTKVSYEEEEQQFTLETSTEVYAGFSAAGPNVKFGNGGSTDHNNPADFTLVPGSSITSWTNPNLGRSYRFAINVEAAGPGADELQLDVRTNPENADELEFTWQSKGGKLYNLRSELDPASSDPSAWPIWDGRGDLVATPPENKLVLPRPADALRLFVIEETDAPPVSVFFDDFDGEPTGWTTGNDGSAGTLWEAGAPGASGPATANSVPHCFATNLAGEYGPDANVWLRSPAVDLANVADATLRFAQFHDIETDFDFGSVRVLAAEGLAELAVLDAVVDGVTADWEITEISLPDEALGEAVIFEFRLVSDEIEQFAGWYIDDVEVTVP